MSVRIIPLGGLGEVGMNAMVVEEDGRRVLVDCGVMFPNDQVRGVEVAVPDFTYLRESGGLDAVLLTHAHEDHIGALPSLLREFPVPVYGPGFTLALVQERLAEHGIDVPLIEVRPREPFEAGPFIVEPIRVTHSTPDAVGFALETGEGVVVHTGDFKIDMRPVDGERFDLRRFSELGKRGVVALLSDSTNSEREGVSTSEGEVALALEKRVRGARGRVIVALFASNIHRIQSLIAAAVANDRKVALCGRSLVRNVGLAQERGLLRVPAGVLVDPDSAASMKPRDVLVISTGAQGEPMSALSRMSQGNHPIQVDFGDLVLFSSRSIPGNEIAIAQLSNALSRRGATVVERALDVIHATGHAQAEEQRMVLDAVEPKHFVPIHGEYRMLVAHARTAKGMGMAASEVFVIEDGDVVEIESGTMRMGGTVPFGRVWLDARGGPAVHPAVLKQRDFMSETGVVVVYALIDRQTGEFVQGPQVSGRGVARFADGSDLQRAAAGAARAAVEAMADDERTLPSPVQDAMGAAVRRVFKRDEKKRPEVLPIAIMV